MHNSNNTSSKHISSKSPVGGWCRRFAEEATLDRLSGANSGLDRLSSSSSSARALRYMSETSTSCRHLLLALAYIAVLTKSVASIVATHHQQPTAVMTDNNKSAASPDSAGFRRIQAHSAHFGPIQPSRCGAREQQIYSMLLDRYQMHFQSLVCIDSNNK